MENGYKYIYESVWKFVGCELRNLAYYISLQNCKLLIRDALFEQEDNIIKHCVFLIYYIIYRESSSKQSIRSHLGAIERADCNYDNALYAYKKYRSSKDEEGKLFFNDDEFPALYKKFQNKKGEKVSSVSGQELSETSYFELCLQTKYNIFDLILWKRIQSSKKCSNADFEDYIFPQIADIYNDIDSAFKSSNTPYFLRSVEYYDYY